MYVPYDIQEGPEPPHRTPPTTQRPRVSTIADRCQFVYIFFFFLLLNLTSPSAFFGHLNSEFGTNELRDGVRVLVFLGLRITQSRVFLET